MNVYGPLCLGYDTNQTADLLLLYCSHTCTEFGFPLLFIRGYMNKECQPGTAMIPLLLAIITHMYVRKICHVMSWILLYRAHLSSSSTGTSSLKALLKQDEHESKQCHERSVTSVSEHYRKEEGKGDDSEGC